MTLAPTSLFCRIMIEHKTQLVPPAKRGTTKVEKEVFANIEKICSGIVVIGGFIRKILTYTAVYDSGEKPDHTIMDEIPFQCFIESDDISEEDIFIIVEQTIPCEIFSHEINFGGPRDPDGQHTVAFKFIEKEIIKISIKKIFSPLKLCCSKMIEHETQLVPPARRGTTKVSKLLFSHIEKICSEIAVIGGFLRKTLTYTAIINGREIPNHLIEDDIPFQCIIENEAVNEGDIFEITDQILLCEVFAHEENFGADPTSGRLSLAYKFVEKDIFKICIRKKTPSFIPAPLLISF